MMFVFSLQTRGVVPLNGTWQYITFTTHEQQKHKTTIVLGF
jgi:thiamine phosphate synthase YjbQ (UPF0047 family)